MTTLGGLLRLVDAPPTLCDWADGHLDAASAWAACPSASWRVWLAGVLGAELGAVIRALGTWAGELSVQVPDAAVLTRHVLRTVEAGLVGRACREACVAAAEEAEGAARQPPRTFRARPSPAFGPLMRSVGWLARSTEGLRTAAVRAEARRMQRARATASYLGAGVDAVLGKPTPLRLDPRRVADDALHAELLYVVAAAAEAAEGLTLAAELAGPPGEREGAGVRRDRLGALLGSGFGDLTGSGR